MTAAGRGGANPLALAEKVIAILDEGHFTATYKYAVLLALLDLCLENASRTGTAPGILTTRQLAGRVVEIYWPHCIPYHDSDGAEPLVQSGGGRNSQAEIIRLIARFRYASNQERSPTLVRCRLENPARFERLLDEVEWKLIEMPLPRLQRFGSRRVRGVQHDAFLYTIAWDEDVRLADVRRYQRGEGGGFDNRILFTDGAGDALVKLNGLLRPLIQRQWTALVARMNGMEDARLEEFLFGRERVSLEPVRTGLQEIQENRCFYCDGRLGDTGSRRSHVDHFVPRARYPNDAVENLVVSHHRCNSSKSDFLPASEHVARWVLRFDTTAPLAAQLRDIAAHARWEHAPRRSISVARGIYNRLPLDMPLWLRGGEFAMNDVAAVRKLLVRGTNGPA